MNPKSYAAVFGQDHAQDEHDPESVQRFSDKIMLKTKGANPCARNYEQHHATAAGQGRSGGRGGSAGRALDALAQAMRWRMVTSWPKAAPVRHVGQRVAERNPHAHPAGGSTFRCMRRARWCRPFEVLDAVGGGVAEIGPQPRRSTGRASSLRRRSSPPVPFGADARRARRLGRRRRRAIAVGRALRAFGVQAFMGGNTGVCMGGWFRHEIKGRSDVAA